MNKLLVFTIGLLLICSTFSQEENVQKSEINGETYFPKHFDAEHDPIDKLVSDHLHEKIFSQPNSILSLNRVEESHVLKDSSGEKYFLKLELQNSEINQAEEYIAFVFVIPWKKVVQIEEFSKMETEEEQDLDMRELDLLNALQTFIEKQIHDKFIDQGISLYSNVVNFFPYEKTVSQTGMKYSNKILLSSPHLDYSDNKEKTKAFHVTVLHYAWLNKFELVDIEPYEYTEEDLQEVQYEQDHSAGGWQSYEQIDSDDEITLVIKESLLGELQTRNLDTNYRVLSVKTQVVAGQNIKVHIVHDEDKWEYEVVIYYQPWNNMKSVTSFEKIKSSVPGSTVRGHAGGWSKTKFENEDQKIQDLVSKGLNEYFTGKGLENHKFEIIDIKKQVVAGLKFSLILKINKKSYGSTVLVQPWKDFAEVLSFNEISEYQHTDL